MSLRSPRSWIIALAVIGLGLSAQPAKAGFSLNFWEDVSHTVPNSTPYAYVDVSRTSTTVTVDLHGGAGTVDPSALYTDFGLNLSSLLPNYSGVTVVGTRADNTTSSTFTITTGNLDGWGTFLQIADAGPNNPSNRFKDISVTFTFGSSISAIPSVAAANSDGFFFAAHYYPTSGSQTGFIAGNGENDGGGTGGLHGEITPAPAGLILLVSGLPVLALRRMLRRKPAVA